MKRPFSRLKVFIVATLQGGLLVVFPVALAFLVLTRVALAIRSAIAPLFTWLPENANYPGLAAALTLLIISFLVGLLARSRRADLIGRKLDHHLEKMPFYGLWRSLTRQAFGKAELDYAPAMVETDDGAMVLALVVEKNNDESYTIFIPTVPAVATGQVFVMPANRVHLLDESVSNAVRSLMRYGTGTGELLKHLQEIDPNRSR